ncbi:hybrid sensor histidine kinase/response regulator [Jannaschia donghaensis]|uniref:histidine kinase n=1 Tax=Jannaschia donghaensis TaxID=420998 RepID=A0A0M6YLN6_9RHOB|nr:response regulator [Jannaschia donghaensis]CTQ51271.1 Blue-light-activated protein [Jannaschia donghaensis]
MSETVEPGQDAEPDPAAFFDDAPCGFLIVGPDWSIRRANAQLEQWIGTSRGELAGRHLRDLLDVAGRVFFDTHFAPLVRLQGAFHEVALNLKRADGSRMPALVNAAERTGADGAIEAMLVTVFNASDRRRYETELLDARNALRELNEDLEDRVRKAVKARLEAEDTLRQAQKMEAIGNLSGGIAHDFNNILQIVSSNLGLLSKRVPKEGADFLANAQAGVGRGAQLAQQLLAIGRRGPVETKVVDAVAVIEGMHDLLERTLRSSTRTSFDIAPGVLPVEVDVSQFENAVLNLCINARDAMEGLANGELSLVVRDWPAGATALPKDLHGPHVEIRVVDTGAGMDAATLAKVFEPFFTTKSSGKGTGLGLAMVYGFARQSSGQVTIQSAVGEGTAISVWLPRSPKPLDGGTVPEPVPIRGGDETVLLVEDDDEVREATRSILADLGYTVLLAQNGAEARRYLRGSATVDLTILDLILRDSEDGIALMQEFKSKANDGGLLLTSGQADAFEDRLDPSFELLRKPYDVTALAAAIRRAIGTDGRAASQQATPRAADLPVLPTGMRVLIVEDEILILMAAVDQLRDLGHTVFDANSGEAAMEVLRTADIDVMITDLGLPGLDGGALARAARQSKPSIGVVFATGAHDLPDLPGAAGVRLSKPYREEDLAKALEAARPEP